MSLNQILLSVWFSACKKIGMISLKTKLQTMVPATLIAFALPAFPQAPNSAEQPIVFRVDVVSRTTKAINYHHRQGSTVVALQGSTFAPKAKGEAKVESKTGATKVDAYVENLPPASTLSDGYLTYVLWAITPEGRAQNLGELMLDGDHARLQAGTELQSFGMIVTAEPYYAVSQPSDYVIMEGIVKKDGSTTGTIMPIDAKFELVSRDGYMRYLPPADRVSLREARKNIPLDLMEARQALAVARSAGALTYASDTMQKAEADMFNAEAFFKSGADKKKVQTLARHVTELAEDARLISVKKSEADSLIRERAANERRENQLTAKARNEAEMRRQAELEIERKNQEAAVAQRQAEAAKAASAAALAEKDRELAQQAERARIAAAEAESVRAKQRELEAETLRANEAKASAERKQKELEQQAALARDAAEKAEAERTKMRVELVRQFNLVLATRESARGLIVNMSDVLFDTGRHNLKPGAREKLAKIAGIILAHPGLKIEVEGHTDSTGTPEINQKLSEQRAEEVRSYLVKQGVSGDMIVSHGFGQDKPVADNSTAAGRQVNRRVELVVNGPLLSNPAVNPSGGAQ